MMDCDTTGVEPDLALVKFKKLVGGGSMQIVNQTVPRALRKLGYQPEQVEAIIEYIAEHGHVVDAPGLRPEHYEVFDCAMGERAISPMGHVRMMAAVQPPCPARSPRPSTCPRRHRRGHREDLLRGLEARPEGARHLPRQLQGRPAAVGLQEARPPGARRPRQAAPALAPPRSARSAAGCPSSARDGDPVLGGWRRGLHDRLRYPDDGLGEVFLKLGKQGSTLAGVMDAFSIAISVGLQYGVPLESYVAKFTNMRFEPAGMTDDPDVRMASSVMDYIFRRLALDHLPYDERAELGILTPPSAPPSSTGEDPAGSREDVDPEALAQSAPVERRSSRARRPRGLEPVTTPRRLATRQPQPRSSTELIESQQGRIADAPLCLTCGTKMRPAGSCYVCEGCGSTSGCS